MPRRSEKIVYRVARTREELEQAFSLVYKEYFCRGNIPKYYKSKLRLTLYYALPSTTTFIAKQGRKVVATVTLIPDSPIGLPTDKIFKKELDYLRRKGRCIAECSQLAIDSKFFGKGLYSMFNFKKLIFLFKLFKLVFDHALHIEGLHDLCCAFNPRHQYLYKFLFFKRIGKVKYYGSYCSPTIAMRLDLTTIEKRGRSRMALHKIFFGEKPNFPAFKNKYRLTPKDLEYFFVKKSDFFKKVTRKQLDYIKSCYPKHKREIEKMFKKAKR